MTHGELRAADGAHSEGPEVVSSSVLEPPVVASPPRGELFRQCEAARVDWARGIFELRPCPVLKLTGIEPEEVEAFVESDPVRKIVGELTREPDPFWRHLKVAVGAAEWIR